MNREVVKAFNEQIFKEHNNTTLKLIDVVAKSLNVDADYAMCIWYLRTRSKWSKKLEDELIDMYRQGYPPPNIGNNEPQRL